MLSAKSIRRWLPLVLLVLLAVLSWRAAEAADIDDASGEPVIYEQQLGSPVLSARRIPQTLQWPVARDSLSGDIQTILTNSTPDTCLIVTVDGRILGQQNTEQPLVPASNQKLITTYAALQTLGAEATFETRVMTDTTANAGVLDGNLYLVGGGDPFLATDAWWAQYETVDGRAHTRLEDLADAVVATGITEITGTIVGDESYFDSERTGQWAQRLIDSNQSGPLTALAVNEGHVGWPEVYAGTNRPRIPSDDPAATAADVFGQLLTERGVAIGPTGSGVAPTTASEIASISSPPLIDVITHVNSYSNNFGAELLVKHLGMQASGEGSTTAGTAAITAFLRQKDFPMSGVLVVDGSGLAETNTLTCSLVAELLQDAGADSAFAGSLSIGGERGSLAQRHVDTPATGHVFAKTGTLNGVTALSGFTNSTVDETALVFAYIVNGELAGQDEAIRALQAPFIEQLVLYPQAPAVGLLQPLEPVANQGQGAPAPGTADDQTEESGDS